MVPTLAKRLLGNRTTANQDTAPWSLRGFALGNDCPGNQVFTCTPYSGWIGTRVALDFRFRNGMINETLYAAILEACKHTDWNFEGFDGPPAGSRCHLLLEDPIRPCLSSAGDTYEMGGGYFLYDTCDGDLMTGLDAETGLPRSASTVGADPRADPTTVAGLLHWKINRQISIDNNQEHQAEVTVAGPDAWYPNAGTYACGQERASLAWLNLEAVRKAIHVQTKAESGRAFSFSTGLPGYGFTAHSLLPLYNTTLVKKMRIMQYSGEADPCVPYLGTMRWIESLQMPVSEPWRPWKSGAEVAGYSTRYVPVGADQGVFFDFVTVRNAGHMAPRYKPAATFKMMQSFLAGVTPSSAGQRQ